LIVICLLQKYITDPFKLNTIEQITVLFQRLVMVWKTVMILWSLKLFGKQNPSNDCHTASVSEVNVSKSHGTGMVFSVLKFQLKDIIAQC
jgi:hypothetical protein